MNVSSPTSSRDFARREQSFPLIVFVQLITFSVALVTCIDFKALSGPMRTASRLGWPELLVLIFSFMLLGLLIGASVGLGQIRKWRSLVLCGATGVVIALLMLAAFAAPAQPLQACFACLLPLLSTFVVRVRTR